MSTTAPAPTRSSAAVLDRAVLDRAVAAMTARRRVEVEVLEAALAWAHAHVVADGDAAAGWRSETIHTPGTAAALFGEQPLPIAGDGAPLVAEFAVIELSAVLEQSHEATLALLGDVLDLAHRLPRLWALVRSLEVPVRLARLPRSACATRRASSPAAVVPPTAPTSTTSSSTSPSTRADHPDRPTRSTSRPCAGGTTGPRPSAPSPTTAAPTARTSGPCRPGTGSSPTHHVRVPDRPIHQSQSPDPDRPASPTTHR